MGIKLDYLDKISVNFCNYSKEQRERFKQDLKVMNEWYQGC